MGRSPIELKERVRPGSIIVSDMWAAYGGIQRLSEGFTHKWVNHSLNFVDPNDPLVHTQTIESTWAHVKAKFKVNY